MFFFYLVKHCLITVGLCAPYFHGRGWTTKRLRNTWTAGSHGVLLFPHGLWCGFCVRIHILLLSMEICAGILTAQIFFQGRFDIHVMEKKWPVTFWHRFCVKTPSGIPDMNWPYWMDLIHGQIHDRNLRACLRFLPRSLQRSFLMEKSILGTLPALTRSLVSVHMALDRCTIIALQKKHCIAFSPQLGSQFWILNCLFRATIAWKARHKSCRYTGFFCCDHSVFFSP